MKKIVSLVLIVTLFLTTAIPSIASNVSYNNLITTDLTGLEDELPEFDINKMTELEKENFFDLVSEEARIIAEYEQSIGNDDFNSDEFKYELIKLFDDDPHGIKPWSTNGSRNGFKLSNRVVASAFNIIIGVIVGSAAVKTFVSKKGVDLAKRIFSEAMINRFKAWGVIRFGGAIGLLVNYVLDYSNFGMKIAELLDRIDKNGKDGCWDFHFVFEI